MIKSLGQTSGIVLYGFFLITTQPTLLQYATALYLRKRKLAAPEALLSQTFGWRRQWA